MMKPTLAAVGAALIVALSVLGGSSALAGDPVPTSSTSSGGCLPPSLGVDLWTQGFPSSLGSSEDEERDCETLCKSHVRKCRRVARLSRTCNSGTAGAIAQLQTDVCNTLNNVEQRRNCRKGADSFRTEIRRCVSDDWRWARGCCNSDNYFDACYAACLDVPPSMPIQMCFTSGACLFDLFNQTIR